jgi:hypothetical protein
LHGTTGEMAALTTIVAALAVIGLTEAALALLLTTRRSAIPWLGAARWSALGLSLVPLTGAGPPWSMGVAAVGVVIAVHALDPAWRDGRQLRDYAAMYGRTPDADPPWWPELERRFREHADSTERARGRREPR